jgi:hypothetical protein
LLEAGKPEYFIDGFLIKYFNIWPIGCEKDNMFDVQKSFLIYLMGTVPSQENWRVQVDYMLQLEEINNLEDVKIEQTDIDVASLQGRDLEQLKKERLASEKKKRISELKKEFGIKEEEKAPEKIEGIPENTENRKQIRQEKLWDLLRGKGLINGL